jgi:hypothetical protein
MSRPLFAITVIGAFCLSFIVTSLVSTNQGGGGQNKFDKLATFRSLMTSLVSANQGGGGHENFGKLTVFRGGGVWQPQYGCQKHLNGFLVLSPIWCTDGGTVYFYDGKGITTITTEPSVSADPAQWPFPGDAHPGELWIAARP